MLLFTSCEYLFYVFVVHEKNKRDVELVWTRFHCLISGSGEQKQSDDGKMQLWREGQCLQAENK